MKPLWIAKVGTTVPSIRAVRGDFDAFFRNGLGLAAPDVQVFEPHEGQAIPAVDDVGAAIVTGSSDMITTSPEWSVDTQRWLAAVVEAGRPVLGVCYGHQMLAQALGGRADWNPRGREIGTIDVELLEHASDDPLLRDLGSPIAVQASHSQSVTALPPDAVHLARNAHDPNQAFRFGTNAWGMQFHPEFDAEIVRGYITERSDKIREEGLDPEALSSGTADGPSGREILQRFAQIWRNGSQ